MKNQSKFLTLVGLIFLLLTACGQVESAPASAEAPDANVAVPENPTEIQAEGATPDNFSKYIGLQYPPLPSGLTEGFGMLIQDSDDHSLSLISEGQVDMLWLGKMTHRDSNGNAFWEVKDILVLSGLGSGLVLLPDGCSLNGAPDSEILAVGRDGLLLQAWRANTTLDVFEVLPTDGIECQSDKAWDLK